MSTVAPYDANPKQPSFKCFSSISSPWSTRSKVLMGITVVCAITAVVLVILQVVGRIGKPLAQANIDYQTGRLEDINNKLIEVNKVLKNPSSTEAFNAAVKQQAKLITDRDFVSGVLDRAINSKRHLELLAKHTLYPMCGAVAPAISLPLLTWLSRRYDLKKYLNAGTFTADQAPKINSLRNRMPYFLFY